MGNATEFVEARRWIAANLARLRARKKWSQQQAADAAGLDLKHWQKMEYGQLNPTLKTLTAAASALGVPVGRILAATRAVPVRRPVGRPRSAS